MDWYSGLYVSEKIQKKQEKLIDKIEHGAGTPGVYVITLSSNGKNLLDFFRADLLMQPALRRMCPLIIGLAESEDSARDIAVDLVVEAYQKTGEFHVEAYLRDRLGPGEEFQRHFPADRYKHRTWFWQKRK